MIQYLDTLISNSIDKFITYADFMNAALYHPEYGYYMKNREKIGRQGDFITASNFSDVYGRLVANWFSHFCEMTGLSPVFCEIGAGNGRFARAFLEEWHQNQKLAVKYIIVESSPYHRDLQNQLLSPEFTFLQVERLEELDPFTGMIFSNELFDALPVHVIEKQNGNLFEIVVKIKENELYEDKTPLTNPAIKAFLKESDLKLREGQRIEIPLQMAQVLQTISNVLEKGLIVTADYGYTNEEWMAPERRRGSLRGFYQHKLIDDVLKHPGDMDITTNIHFDYFIQKGGQFGLDFLKKLRQDEFLIKTGILEELASHYDPNPFSETAKRNRAIRSLIMPGGISSYFNIVIQQKGLNVSLEKLFTE
jgi:SAM-dependent MidA family methyltransferase